LTFDFVHHLIDNKDELNELPDIFDIEIVDKDFPKIENESRYDSYLSEPEIPKK
jgi:hypothetical protein